MLIKSPDDIKKIKENGVLIGEILDKLVAMCKPGVSAGEIDRAAEKMIIKSGGRPAFKGYKNVPADSPFPSTICASANNQLVHGIAYDDDILEKGDIFTIDIGMEWPYKYQISKIKNQKLQSKDKKLGIIDFGKRQGLFSDTAVTVIVGGDDAAPEKTIELLRVTRESMEAGIRAAKVGNSVADIGKAVEDYINSQGKYGIIRDLVGHGVGHAVHEDPRIPNYYEARLGGFILKPGMVIAIEPMVSLGTHKVRTGADGWVIEMADGSLCAHYEHTVIITPDGPVVATRRPSEK
ncbi:MAG: M24 family metallopeptidase [bacterium]|nr:M24 family metallopeptidase [bacterium]